MRARIMRVMATPIFNDFALAYDPVAKRCDMVFNGTDWALDTTPVTAMLVALGTERRADPSDTLPEAVDLTVDQTLPGGRSNPRRGAIADALDPNGQFIGCRLWLLDREKQTADTRLRAAGYALEGLTVVGDRVGIVPTADASWVQPQVLAILAKLGGRAVQLPVTLI
jgi:phage gp46-like protein